MGFLGFFSRDKQQKLDSGLDKTKKSLFSKLAHAVVGKSQVDDDVLDALEETLITSDVGVDTTLEIIKRIQVLFFFLKTYNIAFWIIFKPPLIVSFLVL